MTFQVVSELARRLRAALAKDSEVSNHFDDGGELLEQVAPAVEEAHDAEGVRHKEAA
jgi:hypothetical protein